jgi:hypothetical protein
MAKDSKRSTYGQLTVTPPPKDLLEVNDSDDKTPIVTREEVAWKEIGHISKSVRGLVRATNNQAEYVRQIPEIKKEVREAKEVSTKALQKVEVVHTKLGTQMDNMDWRVSKVEGRGHDCAQVGVIAALQETSLETRQKVEKDITEGVRTRERLDNTRNDLSQVDSEVKKFSNTRRNLFLSLIGVGVFVVSTVGSLIWFLSALNTSVEAEQNQRQESYKRLEKQVESISKAANVEPVQQEIKTLTKAVKASNGHETIEEYCSSLTDRAVKVIKRTVPEGEWPRCRRFGLEPIRHSE